ncbi:lamin tail domain-containing protein [Patescibacteria group bacterium]|nr:lamin tail domain-containing protein [Patescibacteria group bacterium]MBU1922034.1 lamin tail domain-containing protein [Patescibacteria group bacterium]
MKFLNIMLAVLVSLQGFLFNLNFLQVGVVRAEDEAPAVIINEIFWSGSSLSMVDEFIELHNTTDEDIDISNWVITGAAANRNNLIISTSSTIPALGFFIVANYSPENEKSILDIEADFVTSSISLANSDAFYELEDADGNYIDRADDGEGEPFAGDNEARASMARKPDCWDGGLEECWFTSETRANLKDEVLDLATPGEENGWEEPEVNLAPTAKIISPATAEVNVEIIFDGSQSFDPEEEETSFVWYLDDEEAGTDESLSMSFEESATREIWLVVSDGELENSTSTQIVIFSKPEPPYAPDEGDVLINEFLSNPNGGSEWIELLNKTEETIDLEDWTIWDGKSKIFQLSDFIEPNGFFLATLASAKLNNSGDQVILKYNNQIIDRVAYGDWEDEDISDNAPCSGQEHALARPHGAADTGNDFSDFVVTTTPTPGQGNQILSPEEPEEEDENEEESADEDAAEEDEAEDFYDEANADYEEQSDEAEDEPAPLCYEPDTLLINEFVSDPPKGTDEWIEVYNPLAEEILLDGWWIEDGSKTKTYLEGAIAGNDYFVVYEPRGKLNNGGDSIALKDACGNLIDEVVYGDEIAAPTKETSLARDGEAWFLTYSLTPGAANEIIFDESEDEAVEEGEDVKVEDNEDLGSSKISSTKAKAATKEAESYQLTDFSKSGEWREEGKIALLGIVTVLPGTLGAQYFYMGDDQGRGVQVYNYKKEFPDLNIGQEIRVSGTLSKTNEMWRLKTKFPEDMEVLEEGEAVARAVALEEISPDYLAGFIEVEGEVTDRKSSYLYLDDGTGELKVYFQKSGAPENIKLESGDKLKVRGILTATKSELRVEPRLPEDMELLNESPLVGETEKKTGRSYNNLAGLIPLGILVVLGAVNLKKLKKFMPNKK